MKYAIFGDIHANLEAFRAVLEECQRLGVDDYICIGDVVGYNANPRECLDLVRELDPALVVRGNHDEQAGQDTPLTGFNPQAAAALQWTREQLTAEQRAWLRDLPYQAKLGFHATVVHASLDTPGGWAYIFDSLTAAACMNYQITQMCFFGHTHVPLAFEKDGGVQGDFYKEVRPQAGRKYLVNVGSVGQPRDGDPRAAFVVFTPSSRHVEIHRVEYDIEACQRKIRDAGLPDRLADRLALGR